MPVRYTSNVKLIESELDAISRTAVELALRDVQRIAEPKTPRKSGALRTNVQILGSSGEIVWLQPYAELQENRQYGHYTTSGTGPHFAENAVKEVTKDFHTYLKAAGA